MRLGKALHAGRMAGSALIACLAATAFADTETDRGAPAFFDSAPSKATIANTRAEDLVLLNHECPSAANGQELTVYFRNPDDDRIVVSLWYQLAQASTTGRSSKSMSVNAKDHDQSGYRRVLMVHFATLERDLEENIQDAARRQEFRDYVMGLRDRGNTLLATRCAK